MLVTISVVERSKKTSYTDGPIKSYSYRFIIKSMILAFIVIVEIMY